MLVRIQSRLQSIAPQMKTSKYLKTFLENIGHSVHCMNTIAVSLSNLSDETVAPDGLNISWKTIDAKQTSINSRRYAIKSSIVFSVENYFEYLTAISKDALWPEEKNTFNSLAKNSKGEDVSKADRVALFLKQFPDNEKEWIILSELLCHWRNRVVHANSSAGISSKSKGYLRENSRDIYEKYYHFDVEMAFEHFDNNVFTLKGVTTLITILIKTARTVDEYYVSSATSQTPDTLADFFIEEQETSLKQSESNPKSVDQRIIEFLTILEMERDHRRVRKIKKWISIYYGFLGKHQTEKIASFL